MHILHTRPLAAFALAAALQASPVAAATIVADSVADFSVTTQGEGGWQYGWADGELATYTARAFQPMAAPTGSAVWQARGAQVYAMGQVAGDGAAALAVRRWVAPQAGRYRIAGSLADAGGPSSGGAGARIVRGGATLWQATVRAGQSEDYAVRVHLAAGQGVDFVVGAGAADFSAIVTQDR